MGKIFIYTLSEPDLKTIRYVGKTNNIQKRYLHHLKVFRKNHKDQWVKSLIVKNKVPVIEILDEVNELEWRFWEQYWISQIKSWGFNLTNQTNGGEGFECGIKNPAHLIHVKEIHSKTHKNKKLSKETKEKIRASLKGKKNPEHSKFMQGRKVSVETKEKTKNSCKGINSKLTIEDVIKIKEELSQKKSIIDISLRYKVSKSTIKAIKYKKNWAYVK